MPSKTSASKHGGPRPGSGRKKTLLSRQTVVVALEAEDVAKIDRQAQALNLSRSALLRELIRQHLP